MARKPAPRPVNRAPARSNGKHPGGRPRWEPTAVDRAKVEVGAAMGWTVDQIAAAIGVSRDTIERHCRDELDAGAQAANLKVGGALFAKAMKGDVTAIIWWEKTRSGMKDASRVEHTGKDGGPIEYQSLSDEEIDARIAAMTAGDGPGLTTH